MRQLVRVRWWPTVPLAGPGLISYHDSRGTADALHRIQQDAPAIQYVTVEGVIPALAAAVTLVTMVAVTAHLDWQLALVGWPSRRPSSSCARRDLCKRVPPVPEWAEIMLDEGLRAL